MKKSTRIAISVASVLGVILCAGSAKAVSLLPGDSLSTPGTVFADHPDLHGVVLADALRRFSMPDGVGGYVKGRILDRVYRLNSTGMLGFVQQIQMDPTSSTHASIYEFDRTSFRTVVTNADYIVDGFGSVGSNSASRSADGNGMKFKLPRLLAPGEWTLFHYVITNATHYVSGGRATLHITGLPDVTVSCYQPHSAAPPFYTATPFGTTGIIGAYLNDKGQVSLTAGNEVDGFKALLWQPTMANGIEGSLVPIPGLPGHAFHSGMRINSRGQIVGTAFNRADRIGDATARAYRWTPTRNNGATGVTTDLGVLPGGTWSAAWGINDSGQIVGAGDYPGAPIGTGGAPYGTAMLWAGGAMTQLLPSGTFGAGFSINNEGHIAGYGSFSCGTYQGFRFEPTIANATTGTVTNVDLIGGDNYCGPGVTTDINASGTSVGIATFGYLTGSSEQHGYHWKGNVLIDLGYLQFPAAINTGGAVVGSTNTSTGWIYRDGIRTPLTGLVSPDEGWLVGWCSDVNTMEQIVGLGYTNALGYTLMLMTPVRIGNTAPASMAAGSPNTVVIVNGTGFRPGAEVLCNALHLPAARTNSKQLKITVPASILTAPGLLRLQVRNPDGTLSTVKNFTVL